MSEFTAERDEQLMARAQAGETACFAELARRYRPDLLRFARGRLGRVDWAEDAVQEALLAAYRGRHGFDPSRSFRAWLWTIQLHACTRLWKAGQRDPATAIGQQNCDLEARDISAIASREPSPFARAVDEERAAALDRLLAKLPPERADALRLRFFGRLKFHEIAAAQRCSLLTAKNRVKWGLLQLADFARDAQFKVQHDPLR